MKRIDINCDMGESFGAYTIGMDGEVIRYISSANIACGFHAGDPRVMNRTVKLAKENGVGVGAHPGYPDLAGFGRRNMDCTPDEVRDDVIYQIGALQGFCALHGVKLQHVKPHGSLYNMCVGNETPVPGRGRGHRRRRSGPPLGRWAGLRPVLRRRSPTRRGSASSSKPSPTGPIRPRESWRRENFPGP